VDADNGIVGGYEPYLADLPAGPFGASIDAKVATAAHGVLMDVTSEASEKADETEEVMPKQVAPAIPVEARNLAATPSAR
jgi:hypothetical protein